MRLTVDRRAGIGNARAPVPATASRTGAGTRPEFHPLLRQLPRTAAGDGKVLSGLRRAGNPPADGSGFAAPADGGADPAENLTSMCALRHANSRRSALLHRLRGGALCGFPAGC